MGNSLIEFLVLQKSLLIIFTSKYTFRIVKNISSTYAYFMKALEFFVSFYILSVAFCLVKSKKFLKQILLLLLPINFRWVLAIWPFGYWPVLSISHLWLTWRKLGNKVMVWSNYLLIPLIVILWILLYIQPGLLKEPPDGLRLVTTSYWLRGLSQLFFF